MTFESLARKKCAPCHEGTPRLQPGQIEAYHKGLVGWGIVSDHHLRKRFGFKNFREAQAFVNRVGELAEAENHHPEICFTWGKAEISIWTHAIDGLSENDFILAAKIDMLDKS